MNLIIAAILAALAGLWAGAPSVSASSKTPGVIAPVAAGTPLPTDSPAPMPQDVIFPAGPS